MRGERGNEEEREFTHRVVTTVADQRVTIEFLVEPNFCVTTLLSSVSRFIPMEETTLVITSGLRPLGDREGVSSKKRGRRDKDSKGNGERLKRKSSFDSDSQV